MSARSTCRQGGNRLRGPWKALPGMALWALLIGPATGPAIADCADFAIDGDAIRSPLAGRTGDAEAGARVAADRRRGDCVICHQMPDTSPSTPPSTPGTSLPERRFHGNLGPALDAVGARLSPGQLRLRIAAGRLSMPDSIMPNYCLTQGRHGVAEAWRDRPLLSAQEIEDLVAWLAGLDGRVGAAPSEPARHTEKGP